MTDQEIQRLMYPIQLNVNCLNSQINVLQTLVEEKERELAKVFSELRKVQNNCNHRLGDYGYYCVVCGLHIGEEDC